MRRKSATKKINKIIAIAMMISAVSLTGCSKDGDGNEPEVSIATYDRMSYATVPVVKGDITPTVKVFLYAEDEKKVEYHPYVDNISLKKIYVNEGDYVRKGEVLAEFDCEQIDESIKSYESEIEEDKLLIDHYKKLHEIDNSMNFDDDIKLLNEQIEIAKLYVSELQAKKNDYTIIAEREGVVVKVYEINDVKNLSKDMPIMTVIYGSGTYSVDTDNYDFKMDEEFKISTGGADFTVKVIGFDETGKTAYLKLVEDVVLGQTTVGLNITKPTIKDVIYIPTRSYFMVDDQAYVYMLDENGYRYAREIELGEQIGDYIIVTNGLEEGEEVVK